MELYIVKDDNFVKSLIVKNTAQSLYTLMLIEKFSL